ncbi:MAG TPA: hypothetical protein VHO01_09690 [Jatrophihabitans sp.]|nr:hypothetical protein [Jatrophihabitans sp.]
MTLLRSLRQHPLRGRLALAAVAAVLGAGGCLLAGSPGGRAAVSFVLGLLLAGAAFEIGRFNLRLVKDLPPTLSLLMALLSYGFTTVVLALVLVAAKPSAISADAIAGGLVTGVLIWTIGQVAEVWVVQEHP